MAKQLTLEEFEGFMRYVKWLGASVVVLFFVPLVIYGVYMDRRLRSFEESLRYRPPQNIEEYSTEDGPDFLATQPAHGQIVYVPAYSHVYHQNGSPYLLTITLSVRNTSLDREIVVRSVRYFDTKGKEVKSYLAKPLRLPPLATTEFLVERDDATGGSGANFLVEWVAQDEVTEPIIEAVMIDTDGQQGISFARSGRTVRDVAPRVQETKPNQDATMPSDENKPN